MPKIIGRFYLKHTSNGNLIGEFSNDHSAEISTESCDLRGNANGYVGQYHSTWQENGNPFFADLEITHKPNTNNKIFTLKWRGASNFDGEGMFCDDILIGDYHSV
jgi:hypothetical protein